MFIDYQKDWFRQSFFCIIFFIFYLAILYSFNSIPFFIVIRKKNLFIKLMLRNLHSNG